MRRSMALRSLLIGTIALTSQLADAGEVLLRDVLVTNSFSLPAPLFAESLQVEELLLTDHIGRDEVKPEKGVKLPTFAGGDISFRRAGLKKGSLALPRPKGDTPAVAFVSFYLTNKKYQEIELTVKATEPTAVFIDGDKRGLTTSKGEEGSLKTSWKAKAGKSLVLIKTIRVSTKGAAWRLGLTLSAKEPEALEPSLDPTTRLYRYDSVRFFASLRDATISPDGSLLAIVVRRPDRSKKAGKSAIEIWDARRRTRRNVIFVPGNPSLPVFSPDSKALIFKEKGKEGETLYLRSISTGQTKEFPTKARGITALQFVPDGRRVIYLAEKAQEESEKNYRRYEELRDKLTDWNKNRAAFELDLETGGLRVLTSPGEYSLMDAALSPDGEKLAYSRMVPIGRRPFFATEIWIQDLIMGEARRLIRLTTGFENSPLNLCFSPDSRHLAFTSTPDTVGDLAPEEHNVYNSDLYRLDIRSGGLVKLTAGFAPALVERAGRRSVHWSRRDGRIYFLALDRSRRKIFRMDPKEQRSWEALSSSVASVEFFDGPAEGGVVAAVGSSPLVPPAVYVIDTGKGRSRKLFGPNDRLMEGIELGSVEEFDFTNSNGDRIDGWLFKPPGFDAAQEYPLIVYYYGGVAPRLERFTFAHHWLCANDYLLYVLNPSGAYGYGDRFADLHLNDWGTLASRDIIEGTKKLVESHPYIDRSRIGAYGGSYGGFITMDLISKTKLFAAVCSMYGIANITSYWGAGTWGFTYGDMALARSYPWRNREIFVEKSPVFNADKIETPLLLLHGKSDVNVPVEESRQMFTALRSLGRDVVLVEFSGEDHGIVGSTESLITHREIMLEWFDKHLKDEPGAWEARWSD